MSKENKRKRPAALFFSQASEARLKGKCPICKEKITSLKFRDELSKKEFYISGMCQKCQDKTFGTEG